MRTRLSPLVPALLLALTACGEPVGPPVESLDPLGPNEIRVTGRITSATTLIAYPIQLGVWSFQDPTGENTVLASTVSAEGSGRYELRATVTPEQCAEPFILAIWDPFDRFIGKILNGCQDHLEDFNVGPGVLGPQ